MSETYGSDFITITDEEGNEFELEILSSIEHNGCTYLALIPADTEDDPETDLESIIVGALKIKKDVVEKDPKEQGLRKILNFGHTIGHGIESFYGGRLLHGECVALGMLPMCSRLVHAQLMPVFENYGLPIFCEASAEELMPYILHDKKMQGNQISAVYVPEAGSFEIRMMRPEEILERIRQTFS